MRTPSDVILLFCARTLRLFAYGLLSVVLMLYLVELGFSDGEAGGMLTLTMLGDAGVSLWMTVHADRLGRRRMLVAGGVLMAFAGVMFVMTRNPVLLVIAAIVGVISPGGKDIGPFLAIEQASLAHVVPSARRTGLFARYNLAGSFATAGGALCGGWLAGMMRTSGIPAVDAYRWLVALYAGAGILLALIFTLLSPDVEVPPASHTGTGTVWFGLHRSRRVVSSLAALFALDAFAGGFIVQSIMAYWFHTQFGANETTLGGIFFVGNILAGVSALLAARIAARIGLINTMVATHIPSNVLLCCVPFMPTLPLAIGVLMVRFMISQMDVPTRQSYVVSVVDPDERSAASGVTAIARSLGAAFSPALSGILLAVPGLAGAPFVVAGGLKIVYDLMLFRRFRGVGEAGNSNDDGS